MTDHLNTVHDWIEYDDVTDSISVANQIANDRFGNVLSETNSSLDDLGLGFTARCFDEATGLQYNTKGLSPFLREQISGYVQHLQTPTGARQFTADLAVLMTTAGGRGF
ncbi:hypothetical protein AB1L30_11610 [Bremerella sp. JC817]|uniref:hypothetical protein n=1 Tax=Bremerella sp. JC817 TaxID=3231756 RepID=UPI0034584DE6